MILRDYVLTRLYQVQFTNINESKNGKEKERRGERRKEREIHEQNYKE